MTPLATCGHLARTSTARCACSSNTNWVGVAPLLDIPDGAITNYGSIARTLGNPDASRAVGGAIGKNAVGVLIPCHRVITANGMLGGYRWGPQRKRALLAWEAARKEPVTA